jgi:hypothetical protein
VRRRRTRLGRSVRRLLASFFVLGCGGPQTPRSAPPDTLRAEPLPHAPQGSTPLSPPSATPSAPLPPVPEGSLAELSEAVPVTLVTAGRTGRYLVYCAARKDSNGDGKLEVRVDSGGVLSGDALVPELLIGGRDPEAVDDLLAQDPSGRYVVTRQEKRVLLRDVLTHQSVDLGALGFDDRDDVLAYRHHRALAFDARGEMLAYARKSAERVDVVMRELTSGAERVVTGLSGEPYRFRFDGTGETLVVSTIASDTSENGRLEWPYRKRTTPRLACQGGVPHFGVHPELGDRPVAFLVSRATAVAELAPDLALPLGKKQVTRGPDGTLSLAGPGGRRVLRAGDCAGRVLFADAQRELLLIACTGGKNPQRAAVELVGPGSRLELGVELQPTAIDRWPERPARLHPLYPGSEALLVDLELRTKHALSPGDQVILAEGGRALVRRGRKLLFFDADSRRETAIPGDISRLPSVLVTSPMAMIGGRVFDVENGIELGAGPQRSLALTPAGELLAAEGGSATSTTLARGPLRWTRIGRPSSSDDP